MRYHQILMLVAPLAIALPASADWPTGARVNFVAECMENSQAELDATVAKVFCECAADEVSEAFSEEELEAMGGGIDPALEERLIQTTRSCADKLQG